MGPLLPESANTHSRRTLHGVQEHLLEKLPEAGETTLAPEDEIPQLSVNAPKPSPHSDHQDDRDGGRDGNPKTDARAPLMVQVSTKCLSLSGEGLEMISHC